MTGLTVTPAIPASQIVAVNPSVLSAGGSALELNGVILTASPRLPIGSLFSFPDALSVASYCGANAQETALATIYFLGFNNSTKKPGRLFMWQYAWEQPVSAWLRGNSIANLTLAQLQALNGPLSMTIDGVVKSATVNLSSATSKSNAAQIIANTLGIKGVSNGAYTGAISGTTLTVSAVAQGPKTAQYTGSIAGTTLTVSTMDSGTLAVGDLVTGTGVTANTLITALGSGVGGAGTYTVDTSQTAASQTMTDYQTAGALGVGSVLSGTGVTANTYITAMGTGAGGVGTYTVSSSQTAASEAITGYLPAVVYDSISGGLQFNSGTTGVNSTITFGSGTLATSLLLTSATGAVLSQGAAQSTPAAAMDAITAINQNWASFMTTFEPVETDKEAFATWNNGQNNRYHYAMWDTNVLNTGASGPSSAVGTIIAGNYSGTSLIYEDPAIDTVGGELAAFAMGYGASIDFDATQGRATAAFKSQSGLSPQVFSAAVYNYLLGYGMNCYGDFTTANQAFTFYTPGSVSGPFAWLDSYLNQIWLNNQLQLALMVLLTQTKSLPYNQAGYGLVAAACKDPITAAVNNGVIQPGVPLSAAQAAEINFEAGAKIDQIISTAGWYLQIQPATPQTRAARGSPPIKLWYTDGGSIQKIVLASIEVQ